MRRVRVLALVATALVSMLEATPSPALGALQLTLEGPRTMPSTQTATYSGRLLMDDPNVGIPGQLVEIFIDMNRSQAGLTSTPGARTTTRTDGTYSVDITFASPQSHSLLAVVDRGTTEATYSDLLWVSPDGTARTTRSRTLSSLAAGAEHSCALLSDGTARCWGWNNFGQIGDGTTGRSRVEPVTVAGLTNTISIVAGQMHTCALISDGTGRCWGADVDGQLGDGGPDVTVNGGSAVPVTVAAISGIRSLAAGGSSTCAVRSDGSTWCWGLNDHGQLGDGTKVKRLTPVQVAGSHDATAIAVGGDFACALVAGGHVRCWGSNVLGQLGDGSNSDSSTPVEVSGIEDAIAITAGFGHACAVRAGGSVRCWGLNWYGQIGDGTTTTRPVPVDVIGISDAVQITAGFHTCVRLANGRARCWGLNRSGQLGDGTTANRLAPVEVLGLSSIVTIAAGGIHSCALLADGGARCWGANVGQLGNGISQDQSLTPVSVANVSQAASLALGELHGCAVSANGQAKCWGDGAYGRVGNGIGGRYSGPYLAEPVLDLTGAVAITAGPRGGHTCALLADGTIRCWGPIIDRELTGATTITERTTPVIVEGISSATAVSASPGHTCALLSGGSVRCWGQNGAGQLGDGTTTDSSTPVVVKDLPAATAIATGDGHTCAVIEADRSVRCWGATHGGVNYSINGRYTGVALAPVAVPGLSDVAAIDAGGGQTCALLLDRSVRCWGDNYSGQLGDGTTVASSAPVTVQGISDAIALGLGDHHSCAVLSNQSIRCWGANDGGQLGDGTKTQHATPVGVTALTGVLAVAGGSDHTCAVLSSGNVTCWGSNTSNTILTLKLGWDAHESTPVAVHRIQNGLGGTAIATGKTHTCGGLSNGKVRCWGRNNSGQVGNGSQTNQSIPVEVGTPSVTLTATTQVLAGGDHSCALIADGTARCWGANGSGQLGDATTFSARPVPVAVEGLTGAMSLALGTRHTCALLVGGTAACWGENSSGQLGDGTTTTRLTPVSVQGLTGAVTITAGDAHTCALLVDSTVRCWGADAHGQLGDGGDAPSLSPVTVAGSSGSISISTGFAHTCVLLFDGAARCWGSNGSGQLGDDSTTSRSTPTAVLGLSGAVSISAGESHTCALLADGKAMCWGSAVYGRLGNGDASGNVIRPFLVNSLSGAFAIAAGGAHTCTLLSDGSASCWGQGLYGQLGDTTANDALAAVKVASFP